MGGYIGNTCIKISENQFEKIIFWNQIVSDIKAFSHISVHMTMDSDSLIQTTCIWSSGMQALMRVN